MRSLASESWTRMKITDIKYEPSTHSTPAFLDIYTADGDRHAFTGKLAKRLKNHFKVGDDFTEGPW